MKKKLVEPKSKKMLSVQDLATQMGLEIMFVTPEEKAAVEMIRERKAYKVRGKD